MRIKVAPDLCCGAGRCVEVAPDVYRLSEGFNALVTASEPEAVPAGLEASARLGARACPERAISLLEDSQ